MSDAEKKLLSAFLHFAVDTTLAGLSDDLVAKIPGASGVIAGLVWGNAKAEVLAVIDKEIDAAIAQVAAKPA